MVDVGIQSESEEFNDTEMNAFGWNTADRKPSFLQVVPEEEHEDDELEMVCFLTALVQLTAKFLFLINGLFSF